MDLSQLSGSALLLVAGLKLEREGHTPFDMEDLIVAAWQLNKDLLGLKGYERQYPDSNHVIMAMSGKRGLPAKGFFDKVGPKLFELTPIGRMEAKRLTGEENA